MRIVMLGNSGQVYTSQVYVVLGDSSRLEPLEKLCARDVRRIYFGHGAPLTERRNEGLRESQKMTGGGRAAGDRQKPNKNQAPVTA
jgi:hypothetical protein